MEDLKPYFLKGLGYLCKTKTQKKLGFCFFVKINPKVSIEFFRKPIKFYKRIPITYVDVNYSNISQN